MFGLSVEKILVIVVVAAFIIGPQRLPHYAAKLAELVRSLKQMANNAKERVSAEMGPEFEDVDWKKLDPRQYDPRRIIRTALLDDEPMPTIGRPAAAGGPEPVVDPVEEPVTEAAPVDARPSAAA